MLDTAQRNLSNKEKKGSKIIQIDDYLFFINHIIQKKLSLKSNITVALDIRYNNNAPHNLTKVKNIYFALSNIISKIEIPNFLKEKILLFTISLKDNFTLTAHLDCKLNATEIDQVIKMRHQNKVINYLYSDINSYIKIIVPIQGQG